MNRNVNAHFALNPTNIDIQRSQFDRSSSVKLSGNAGDIIPFYVDEVLPGDTFKVKSSKVVRLQTLVAPLMDNVYLDTYWFYIPMRLVWDHAVNFFGEQESAWFDQNADYKIPRLNIGDYAGTGSLMDYMGIPPTIQHYSQNENYPDGGVNALPFRCYAKVCDDWFRASTVSDPLVIYTGDATKTSNAITDDMENCYLGGPVYKASKFFDYFTACTPAPQRGPDTVIQNINSYAPVGSAQNVHGGSLDGTRLLWSSLANGTNYVEMKRPAGTWPPTADTGNINAEFGPSDGTLIMYPRNLYADVSQSLGLTINDLRTAFQVQRFYERMTNAGRYVEVLKTQFGVTSPDARLQRSEYLGGNRIPLTVHEVTNNTESEQAFLGDLGAMSKTVDSHDDFVKSFTEHGYVIGVCVVRYDHTYGEGLDRMWSRYSKFDFYWPVFANIGEQAVKKKELWFYPGHISMPIEDFEVPFGFQEAWADYRYKPNRVCGEMRVGVTNSLAAWHLADHYDSIPSLSQEWLVEDPSNLDRALTVGHSTAHQFFADIYVQNICSRAMPTYSIPGLADHH